MMLAAILVFLSHANVNRTLTKSVVSELRTAGCDVWVDRERIRPGQNWTLEVKHAIERADVVLVLVTRASNASTYVIGETLAALDAGKTVIPVRGDDAPVPWTIKAFGVATIGQLGIDVGCSPKFTRKEF